MNALDLFGAWLLGKEQRLTVLDNGYGSIAIGTKTSIGHNHFLGYVFLREGVFTIYTYRSGKVGSLPIAYPTSFEMVHKALMSGTPALCFECKEHNECFACGEHK